MIRIGVGLGLGRGRARSGSGLGARGRGAACVHLVRAKQLGAILELYHIGHDCLSIGTLGQGDVAKVHHACGYSEYSE